MFVYFRFWSCAGLCFFGALAQGAPGAAATPASADLIIQRALARAKQAEAKAGQPGYTYTKVSVTEELDPSGKVRERKEKVYQVFFRDGASYARLLQVNGHAPGAAEVKQQSANEMNRRQLLGQPKTASSANGDNFLTPELVARYNFSLRSQRLVNGRSTYEVAFQPKDPPEPVHRLIDRLLDRISGTVWIDAEESEIARAEFHLRSEVDFLGGMAGRLRKLAYTLTRSRMPDGVWLNVSTAGDFEGRKLLDSLRIKTNSHVTNFQPLPEQG